MDNPIVTLVVDDDEGVRFFLEETIRRMGHHVITVGNGEDALNIIRDTPINLVLIDLKLGTRIDGLRVLEAVRWRWPEAIPIILTGHGSLETAMVAIREGVARYLLKPINPVDLKQTITEVLEKKQKKSTTLETQVNPVPEILQKGPFVIDLHKHQVSKDGCQIDVTPHEFKLLVYLAKNSIRVVPPSELVLAVLDYECKMVQEARQIIKWYIHRLRQKIEPDPANPRYILSVRGVGYRFDEEST